MNDKNEMQCAVCHAGAELYLNPDLNRPSVFNLITNTDNILCLYSTFTALEEKGSKCLEVIAEQCSVGISDCLTASAQTRLSDV